MRDRNARSGTMSRKRLGILRTESCSSGEQDAFSPCRHNCRKRCLSTEANGPSPKVHHFRTWADDKSTEVLIFVPMDEEDEREKKRFKTSN